MPSTMNCPGCHKPLRLRDGLAGRTIKCPRCGHVIAIAAKESVMLEEVSCTDAITSEPPHPAPRKAILTTCGEEDDFPRTHYKPCPRCGEEDAKRVLWTPWGSFLGPVLFTHVRCPGCGYAYNGKSGRSNLVPALVFVTVPLLLILTILGVLVWYIHSLGHL